MIYVDTDGSNYDVIRTEYYECNCGGALEIVYKYHRCIGKHWFQKEENN